MKTQIYLDENGSPTFNHHSNHRITYDKNFVLMSIITIGVLILLFMILGARGQNVNTNQNNSKHKNTVVKKHIKNKKTNKLEVPVIIPDTLINDNIRTGGHCPTYTEDVYTVVEEMPQFPGGTDSLNTYIRKELDYNREIKWEGDRIYGTIYITFVVSKTGDIRDVKLLRGIGGGYDEEAVRIIKAMPKWIPGRQNGIPVSVQFNLPIIIELR